MDGNNSTKQTLIVAKDKKHNTSLFCSCGVLQVSGRRGSPVWLKTAVQFDISSQTWVTLHEQYGDILCFSAVVVFMMGSVDTVGVDGVLSIPETPE